MMKVRNLVACVALVAVSATLPVVASAVDATPAGAAPTETLYPTPTPGGGGATIAVGPDGNLWFAENNNNKIAKATTDGVITEYTIPTEGAEPHGVAAGPDGNVWFTEHGANKIGRITPAGTITEFTIPTAGTKPLGITAGPDGNLWFVEYEGNQVGKVTPAGAFTEYPLPTELSRPYSIVAGPDGNLWFTEALNKKIGRITPAGVITEFPMPDSHAPFIITAGPDGNLWATSHHAVARITTAGVISEFPTVDPDGAPNFIAAGPDGNVWFSDIGHGNKVSMVTPAGVVTEHPFHNGLPSGVVGGPDGNIWTITSVGLVKVRIVPDPTGEFTSLTPARLVDTRPGFTTIDGQAEGIGAVGHNSSIDVQITGRGGVPAAGEVSAVVLNATVTQMSAFSYLTVWPTGVSRPTISNLNYGPGQTVPNLVTVALGTGGKVSVYNNQGSVHVILDVVGYYSTDSGPLGSRFHGLTPFRYFDTRNGSGGVPATKVGQGSTLKFTVTGKGGVPATGVTGVVMNVTITEPTAGSFLTVFPDDVPRPNASNLNFGPGQTVPNLVTVRVPPSGIVDFYNHLGVTHLIADVVGYYDDVKTTDAGRFIAVDPFRKADTRVLSPFPPPGKVGPSSVLIIRYPGFQSIPTTGVGSMVTNVTVTEPDALSFVTVFPSDSAFLPLASNLNFGPGQTIPNQVITRVSTGPTPGGPTTPGWIAYYNMAGSTHLVVDVFGYFTDETFALGEVGASDTTVTGPEMGTSEIG